VPIVPIVDNVPMVPAIVVLPPLPQPAQNDMDMDMMNDAAQLLANIGEVHGNPAAPAPIVVPNAPPLNLPVAPVAQPINKRKKKHYLLNIDARFKIIEYKMKGYTSKEIVHVFNANHKLPNQPDLGLKTIQTIIRTFQQKHRIDSTRVVPEAKCKLTEQQQIDVVSWLEHSATITNKQLVEKCEHEFGIRVSQSTIRRISIKHRLSYKQIVDIPIERNSASNKQARYDYVGWATGAGGIDIERTVWLDEAGFHTHMRRNRGRSRIGTKAIHHIQGGIRGANLTVIGAMHARLGVVHFSSHLGGTNTDKFVNFMQQLCNRLAGPHTIILDNASIHKHVDIIRVATTAGHTIRFLPPYSPFLNPIEEVWAQWKAIVRQNERTTEADLIKAVELAHTKITQQQCYRYYQHTTTFYHRCSAREDIL